MSGSQCATAHCLRDCDVLNLNFLHGIAVQINNFRVPTAKNIFCVKLRSNANLVRFICYECAIWFARNQANSRLITGLFRSNKHAHSRTKTKSTGNVLHTRRRAKRDYTPFRVSYVNIYTGKKLVPSLNAIPSGRIPVRTQTSVPSDRNLLAFWRDSDGPKSSYRYTSLLLADCTVSIAPCTTSHRRVASSRSAIQHKSTKQLLPKVQQSHRFIRKDCIALQELTTAQSNRK